MTRSAIFACFMCFVVGGCLGIFVIVGASRPQKKVLLGRDAYHAQMTEMLFLLFLLAPIVAGAPYLLARWDAYKRADNARRRMERMAK